MGTGDHDYRRDCLSLANINAVEPCTNCLCNRGNIPWFDFRLDAKWVNTSRESEPLECTLFSRQPPCITRRSVWPDWMHDKYLGTDKVPGFSFLDFFCSKCCSQIFILRFLMLKDLRLFLCFLALCGCSNHFPVEGLVRRCYEPPRARHHGGRQDATTEDSKALGRDSK